MNIQKKYLKEMNITEIKVQGNTFNTWIFHKEFTTQKSSFEDNLYTKRHSRVSLDSQWIFHVCSHTSLMFCTTITKIKPTITTILHYQGTAEKYTMLPLQCKINQKLYTVSSLTH